MTTEPTDNQPSSTEKDETDKLFLNGDSSLQSKKEAEAIKDDEYYEVDEKKLVTTSIGDGTPHEEGLANAEDDEVEKDD